MKVAFIITGLNTGGAEMMLFKLLQHNDTFQSGMLINLSSNGEMQRKFKSLGIRIINVGMKRGRFSLFLFFKLINILRKERPDLVATWLYHSDLLGGLAAWFLHIPVCWNIRSSGTTFKTIGKATTMVMKICALLSAYIPEKIVCNSRQGANDHIEFGYESEKMEVIPNGFDIKSFSPQIKNKNFLHKQLALPNEALLVGMAGRFDPIKNHKGFIEAAKIVVEKIPHTHFILFGSGIDEKNRLLTSWIDAAKIRKNVHLLGLRQDVPQIMSALKVSVCASLGEAFPNVVGEAMACGVPSVVTDVGDVVDLIGNAGIAVPPGDIPSLARGIITLLEMSTSDLTKMGRAARARIVDNYKIEIIANRFETVYEQCLTTGIL